MTDSAAPFAKQGYYFVTFDKNVINKHMDELILYANKIYPNWTVFIGGVSKYISTEGLNPLRLVTIESKQKWLIEWTLMAFSCLFTANSQNLINVHNFSSTSVSQGVQWLSPHSHKSKDVHHSCDIVLHHSLSVTRRPWWWRTSSLRHWRDPPGDCHPVARRLQRMDGERATVRPSVLRAASSQLLAYSKRSPAQLKNASYHK